MNGNTQARNNNMYTHRNVSRPQENGNVLIDYGEEEHEFSLTAGHINTDEIESINESLKDMGLTLNDPNVWIGDA
jgi:hypothetical protein